MTLSRVIGAKNASIYRAADEEILTIPTVFWFYQEQIMQLAQKLAVFISEADNISLTGDKREEMALLTQIYRDGTESTERKPNLQN